MHLRDNACSCVLLSHIHHSDYVWKTSLLQIKFFEHRVVPKFSVVLVEPWSTWLLRNNHSLSTYNPSLSQPVEQCRLHNDHRGPRFKKYDLDICSSICVLYLFFLCHWNWFLFLRCCWRDYRVRTLPNWILAQAHQRWLWHSAALVALYKWLS